MFGPKTITVKGLEAAIAALYATAAGSEAVMARTMFSCTMLCRDTARKYAPRAPTLSDLRKDAKENGTGRKFAERKATGVSRPKPGGLERSIDFASDAHGGVVFVASNSEAGRYAFMISEEKGTRWQNRGIGTISKGSNADEKFIQRAILDSGPDMFSIIQSAQAKAVKMAMTRGA